MPTYEIWDCSDKECESYTLLDASDSDYEGKKVAAEAKTRLHSFDASDWYAAKPLYHTFLDGYRTGKHDALQGHEIVHSEEVIAETKDAARTAFGEKYPEATILTISNGYPFGKKCAFEIKALHPAKETP